VCGAVRMLLMQAHRLRELTAILVLVIGINIG